MRTEINEIRELIRQDKIEEALSKSSQLAPIEFTNSLIVISNRYKKWKTEKRIGLGENPIERNGIIHGLLEIIAEMENNSSSEKTIIVINEHRHKEPAIDKPNTMLEVFISYSHKDKKYLDDLKRHFNPITDRVNFWDDSKIEPGQKWHDKIKEQMLKSKLAILLISADFFNSDFIKKNELPPLLKAAENAGTKILSIILKPCLWEEYPEITQYQSLNDPAQPISSMNKNTREIVWVKLVKHIKKLTELNQQ